MTETPETLAHIDFTRWLSELRADVAETVGGVLLRGARAVPVGKGHPQGTTRPLASPGAFLGLTVVDPGALATASVSVYDGRDASTGTLLGTWLIGSGVTAWFGPSGINVSEGLFIEFTDTTSPRGSVFLRGVE